MTFNQLPLLELLRRLIYLFILIIGFFSHLTNFPLLQGIESGESRAVILSGVVKIHLALQFISLHTLCSHPFIYLCGTIKINWFGLQSAGLPFFHGFLWFSLNRQLEAAELSCRTSCSILKWSWSVCPTDATNLFICLTSKKPNLYMLRSSIMYLFQQGPLTKHMSYRQGSNLTRSLCEEFTCPPHVCEDFFLVFSPPLNSGSGQTQDPLLRLYLVKTKGRSRLICFTVACFQNKSPTGTLTVK